ncbi:MAG: penicillin-binding protein 1A [Alphaproteobacteria bacterium]|nr:penicillin-binding protein 1A [Alphaproteobacteria bacterium]
MRLLSALLSLMLLGAVISAAAAVAVFNHYNKNLPEYTYLKDYQPPTLSRIYADDGRMMAVVASEQRLFVPIDAIPKKVVDAFLSAEDSEFFQHNGIDYLGILRAALVNLQNVGRERHPMGASTITQQVAKNMLLTNEISISRKIREAILAMKLEKALTKQRILEIYLNEIFLGNRSYGIAAAALNYFNKSLDELTLPEAAYLAALPKAPNNYNPVRDHAAAVARRNWVLGRMAENGRITREEAELAKKEPLETRTRGAKESVTADYFAEEVRRQLVEKFGEELVLEGGLAVKTSLDPRLQAAASKALHDGLIAFDRRNRGWRGPVAHLTDLNDWQKQLKGVPIPPGSDGWQMAIVLTLKPKEVLIGFADDAKGRIPWEEISWARKELANEKFGPAIHKPSDVLNVGDVIMVEPVTLDAKDKPYPERTFTLRQIPTVQGAIVALDPHTGRVFAMNGGFSTKISQFNRATQAMRQPGSSFKPFIYMAGLDKGFTPASLISDSPTDYEQGPGLPLWRPENYGGEDFGPLPLRQGVEKSQNVMTVRLANAIGMPTVVEYAKKFGIADEMPELLSFSLGAKETTPLRMVTAYGMIVNGGKKIVPTLIDRVQDRDGKTIWRADSRICQGCQSEGWTLELRPPDLPDTREQIEDPRTAYQMVNILQGVVKRGTAVRLRDIDFPLAGKTGTTNDSKDAWFIGFTPDLVCGVYVGFDNPVPLGSRETGSSVAIPIFRSFILEAIKDKDPIPFRVPPGLRMVRVNPRTETLAPPSDKEAIWEAFIPGTEPQESQIRPILGEDAGGMLTAPNLPGVEAGTEGNDTGTEALPPAPMPLPGPAPTPAPVPAPATTGTGGLY